MTPDLGSNRQGGNQPHQLIARMSLLRSVARAMEAQDGGGEMQEGQEMIRPVMLPCPTQSR